MPSTAIAPSPKTRSPRRRQTENHSTPTRRVDLKRAFGKEGESEYGRLLRVLRAAQGRFVLLPIESDLDYDTREAFLQRLGKDLSARDISLQTVQLSRTSYDVLTELNAANTADVVALIGLEETPGIVLEAGAPPQRPPAIAMLNQGREVLRHSLHAPLLLWCSCKATALCKSTRPISSTTLPASSLFWTLHPCRFLRWLHLNWEFHQVHSFCRNMASLYHHLRLLSPPQP